MDHETPPWLGSGSKTPEKTQSKRGSPFSPTMTSRCLANFSRGASGKAAKFLSSSQLSTAAASSDLGYVAFVEVEIGHEAGTAEQVLFLGLRCRAGVEWPASLSADIRRNGLLAGAFVLNELRAWLGYSGVDYRLFRRSCDGGEVDSSVRDGGRFRRDRDQGVTTVGEALQPWPAPGQLRSRERPDDMLRRVPG